MKKAIAYLFIFLLLLSIRQACERPAVLRTLDGKTLQHSHGKKLRPIDTMASDFQSKEVKLEHEIQKKDNSGRTLTYELLEEQPFNNSEIMISDYAPVLIVPANVKYQETFVSLSKDARDQKIGPWRGEVRAGPKRLFYSFNVEDATGSGTVRISKPKISVEYQVSENAAVGVEASSAVHDKADAEAWGKSIKDEREAQVKYKLLF